MNNEKGYRVIRFFKSGEKKTVLSNVSLEIARLHCSDPRTRKENIYFDGYTKI